MIITHQDTEDFLRDRIKSPIPNIQILSNIKEHLKHDRENVLREVGKFKYDIGMIEADIEVKRYGGDEFEIIGFSSKCSDLRDEQVLSIITEFDKGIDVIEVVERKFYFINK